MKTLEDLARDAGLHQDGESWFSDSGDPLDAQDVRHSDLARFAALVRAQAITEAAAEIERLQATLKLQQASYERELALDAATAAEEIERLQADAARYRYIRDNGEPSAGWALACAPDWSEATYDAVIDAAIAASASKAERA